MAKRKMLHPYWRPNFRISATLPDIKVVRTGFLVNGVAIAFAVIALFMVLQKEYRANALEKSVDSLQAQVDNSAAQNKTNLALNARFLTAGKYVEELHRFHESPFQMDALMVNLSNSVPEGLIFNTLKLDEVPITVAKKQELGFRITISGTVDELTILDAYKGKLLAAEFLNPDGYKVDIDEAVRAPDPVTRIFPYQLSILVKPQPQKKGGK